MSFTKQQKLQIFLIAAVAAFFVLLVGRCNKHEIVDVFPKDTTTVQEALITHGNEIGDVDPNEFILAYQDQAKDGVNVSASPMGPVNASYPTKRALYLDGTDTVYNNPNGRAVFAKYCQDNGFNRVKFYKMSTVLGSSGNFPNMATFNTLLASKGVTKREAVLGSSSTTKFQNYWNYTTNSSQDFTGLDLELEFWNSASSWNTWIGTLNTINTYCDSKSPDLNCSFYMGWFKNLGGITDSAAARQMQGIANNIDLHCYQNNTITYSYTKSRLEAHAKAAAARGIPAKINILASTEQVIWGANNNFQGNLLKTKGYPAFEKLYIDSYNANASTFVKTWIRIDHFVYFTKRYNYKAILPK